MRRGDIEGLAGFEDMGGGFGFALDAVGPEVWVLTDDGEGVVVDGNDAGGVDELDGFEGVVGPHGVVVADGEEGEVDAGFADEFHIAEEGGVGGVVDGGTVLEFEEEAGGVAAVTAAWDGRSVEGEGEFDVDPAEVVTAAVLHAVDVFEGLGVGLEPLPDFEVGDDGRAGAFGDLEGVAEVVFVSVGDENEVGVDGIGGGGGLGVAVEEGVDEEAFAVVFDEDAGVAEELDVR